MEFFFNYRCCASISRNRTSRDSQRPSRTTTASRGWISGTPPSYCASRRLRTRIQICDKIINYNFWWNRVHIY